MRYQDLGLGKKLSLLVVLGYIVVGCSVEGAWGGLRMALLLVFPMSLIWFSDEIGNWSGSFYAGVTAPTPALLVRLFGWVFLLLPAWMPLVSGCIRKVSGM